MSRSLLTTNQCARAKPGDTLRDGGGLFLVVREGGTKAWVFRFRLAGSAGTITLGQYPDLPLADARVARDRARVAAKSGTAPKIAKRRGVVARIKADGMTLAAMTRQWFGEQCAKPSIEIGSWTAEHAHRLGMRIERHIIKPMGDLPIADLTPRLVIDGINQAPASMRRSLLSALDGVFQYSIAEGARNDNPAQMIRKRIPSVRSESRPAALTLDDARAVLLAVEAVTAHPSTILCHRLIALTGLRVWEASRLRWEYVPDLGATEPVLIIPEAAMKGRRRKHIVPLAPQTVHLLRWARRFSFRGEGWIFPAAFCKGACVSASAIEHVLQRARPMSPVRHVTHGWRATFSTVMNETLKGKGDRDIIDLMIHHKPQAVSGNELAYNFAEYMPRRREIACQWADMLLEGMPPLSHVLDAGLVEMPSEREASVIPLQRATGARS